MNDLSSPQAVIQRRERMERADIERAIRERALSDAKAAIRLHQVRGSHELLAMLQCVHANSVGGDLADDYRAKLLELICDFEDSLTVPEPELAAFGPRGEYDGRTQNVHNRSQT